MLQKFTVLTNRLRVTNLRVCIFPKRDVKQLGFATDPLNKWKTILQIIASIISAALTALGTTSCLGYGPI